jgi:hypothetical protein
VAASAGPREVPDGRRATACWLPRPAVVIAASAVLALALCLVQLSRPGRLSGFTQYDDGVYFGNALRLVHGAIAYRDFAMMRPTGSMLLLTPAAVAARVFGTARGMGAARLLTALARPPRAGQLLWIVRVAASCTKECARCHVHACQAGMKYNLG